jgi:hypothetical protein
VLRRIVNNQALRFVTFSKLARLAQALTMATAFSRWLHARIRYSRVTELMVPYNPTLAMPNLPKPTLPKREDGAQPVCRDIAVSDQISTSIPISMTCVAGMLK